MIDEPGHCAFKIVSTLYECLFEHGRRHCPAKDTGQNIEWCHIVFVWKVVHPRIAFDVVKVGICRAVIHGETIWMQIRIRIRVIVFRRGRRDIIGVRRRRI